MANKVNRSIYIRKEKDDYVLQVMKEEDIENYGATIEYLISEAKIARDSKVVTYDVRKIVEARKLAEAENG